LSFIIDPYRYASCPAEALAFIAAAGITDTTQKQAICTLVSDLQAFGIWSKMKAIYPFVGGTSSTHKWNLKDPRDLDAAFRLVFNGGGTHSSTGYLPNGTNGYADTKLNPSTQLSIDDMCFSIYCRTNTTYTGYDFGATTTTTGVNLSFTATLRYASGGQQFTYYGMCHNPTENSILQTNSAKNFIFNKTSSTNVNLFQNTTKTSSSVTNRSLVNGNCYIGARFLNGSASGYISKEYAFLTVGNSLTDTEAANLYTAVQAYQTTLGRQV